MEWQNVNEAERSLSLKLARFDHVYKKPTTYYYNTNTIIFMPKCYGSSLCWYPFECILDQCFRRLWYEPPPFTSFEQPSLFSFICDCSSSCKYLPEYIPRFRQHCSSSCGCSRCSQSLRVAKFTVMQHLVCTTSHNPCVSNASASSLGQVVVGGSHQFCSTTKYSYCLSGNTLSY